MCEKCNTEHPVNTSCFETVCEKEIPVQIQTQTDDVFYGKCSQDKLENLNLNAGTDLTTILEKIDYKFGDSFNSVNVNAFNLTYLRTKYTITTIKELLQCISLELGNNNTRLNTLTNTTNAQASNHTALSNKVNSIYTPSIVDSSNVGFTVNDNILVVLQKIVDKFNTVNGGSTNLTLSATDTNTIDITLSGENNTTIKADVKVSSFAGNRIVKLTDGLFVAPSTSSSSNQLEVQGNQIRIVGGSFVSLPILGNQTLSRVGNRIYISGGNDIILPDTIESSLSVNNTNSIVFSQSGSTGHNISANVKVSSMTGNKLRIEADGVYVAMDATDVLNQISASQTMKNLLCSIVASCSTSQCYKWYIQNTASSSTSVNYVDLNGNSQTFTMGANTTLSISGTKILSVPSSTLIITFLGAC